MVSVEMAYDLGDANDDPDGIQTEQQERTKEVLSIDRMRKLFRESEKARISIDEGKHMIPIDGRKTTYRDGRVFRLDQKNNSCDASFGRHTCHLSMNNMHKDMNETSLFYGLKMH